MRLDGGEETIPLGNGRKPINVGESYWRFARTSIDLRHAEDPHSRRAFPADCGILHRFVEMMPRGQAKGSGAISPIVSVTGPLPAAAAF